MTVVYLLVGILLLTLGGELLVRGALALGEKFGVSPLLAGLVIVGFGTSMPELVVSLGAALKGQAGIAIGNVVGSNISNILLILGACGVVAVLPVEKRVLKRDGGALLGATLLFLVLSMDGELGLVEGLVLLVGMTGYLIWAYRSELGGEEAEVYRDEAEEIQWKPTHPALMVGLVVVGLGLLIGGAQFLIVGATDLARMLGISETVIALTVVAVGTSLPELAVSLLATIRGHVDVAVGNILGSNLFNVLGILGVSALFMPLGVGEEILRLDRWVLLGATGVLLVFLWTGLRIRRLEGLALLLAYVAYVSVLFL